MNNSRLSPEDLIAYNEAFAKAMTAMNEVAATQRAQIIHQVTSALNGTSGKDTLAVTTAQSVKDAVTQMAPQAATATTPLPEAEASMEDGYNNLVRNLNMAQENAVANQQQTNITALAALAELLARLLGTAAPTS